MTAAPRPVLLVVPDYTRHPWRSRSLRAAFSVRVCNPANAVAKRYPGPSALSLQAKRQRHWVPACAGMTKTGGSTPIAATPRPFTGGCRACL